MPKPEKILFRTDIPRLTLGDWWKAEDLPVDWDRFLPKCPLEVEVGFGSGEFLCATARLHPERRFVGIERFGEGYRRLLASLGEEGLSNVLPAMGDAFVLMNLLFENESVANIYINFPDPWPKARHARRRLLSEEFFRIAARKLTEGGCLFAATDDVPYAHWASEAFESLPVLDSTHPDRPWLETSPYSFRTRYESKWIAESRPLHYFVYVKRSKPDGSEAVDAARQV